jgi:hypothetical protein
MKKIYLITLLFCALCTPFLKAQLNGIYTINSALATGGTNFQSFTAFAAVINTAGISGPVTVSVSGGPFNEQVNFLQITGSSATNIITINGNGCTISFTSAASASPHTFMLSGTDYMTVNDLNIVGNGATYALACHLWNGANNNTFNGCSFTTPFNGTSTTQVPFSISGSGTAATTAGNSGNDNTINTCTTVGGYYNTVFYGSSSAPYNTGNKLTGSIVRDFYLYGFYNVYCINTTAKSNIIERLNRTTVSTTYAMYFSTGSITNELIEGNHIRKLFNGIAGSTSAAYCIYLTADATLNNENIVKNNVISDINSNGVIYGIYLSGAAYVNAYHNTISLDDATSTAGTTYGIYASGPNDKVKNNIVSVGRGGTGAKYGLYYTTAATSLESDYNDVSMTSTVGTNYPVYYTTGYSSLGAFQAAFPLYDQNSKDADPVYTNTATMNYVPTSTVINNMATYVGVNIDFNGTPRSLGTPDPGAFEFYNTPCSGLPAANSVLSSTFVYCPGSSVTLGLSNTFTNTGYIVQWQASTTSSLGPYTAIPGATLAVYNTPTLNVTTYYNAIVTCTVSSGLITAGAGQITIAATTTNTVPYFEGFEGITKLNQLPNCSWAASNVGGSTLTYTSNASLLRVPRNGSRFASFSNSPSGTSYFYSNGIYLVPNITYSASLWYIAETAGYNDWSDLSIMLGQAQTATGLVTLASVSPVSPNLYTPLSNTFTVASPGLYYVAIKGTSGAGVSPYLSWDDLEITIPCSENSPSMTLISNATTICSGQTVNISASGADTYSWNTGSTNSSISETPVGGTTYIVMGSFNLTGCTTTLTQNILVNPSPQIIVAANSPVVCIGSPAILTAQGQGQLQYVWAHGVTGPQTVVSPLVITNYSVVATNGFNCQTIATIQITVNPLPGIIASAGSSEVCAGESVNLTAVGAITYSWTSNFSTVYVGNPVSIVPQSSGIYTVNGTDANGCVGTANVILSVNECTGIQEPGLENGIRIYPNPVNDKVTIEINNAGENTVEVLDVTGRIVKQVMANSIKTELNTAELAGGVYYVRVQSDVLVSVTRLIKQ